MGKGVEGRREMDLVPHSKLGGSGKGRLLPKGPWLMVLIPNSIWGLVQPSGGMVASGDCQEKMYKPQPPVTLPYCPLVFLLPTPSSVPSEPHLCWTWKSFFQFDSQTHRSHGVGEMILEG